MRGQVRVAYPPLVGLNGGPGDVEAAQGHPRACVVGDQVDVRQWVVSRLETLGFVCSVARSAAEGLALIATRPPDLAVVDSRLPDGRGIDLCRAISGSHPGIALILHTGVITAEDEAKAYDAGVTRVVLKSIQGDDLAAAVEELARRRRAPSD